MGLGSLVITFNYSSFYFSFYFSLKRIEFQVTDTGGYFKCRRKDILVKIVSIVLFREVPYISYTTKHKHTMQSIAATDALVKGNE